MTSTEQKGKNVGLDRFINSSDGFSRTLQCRLESTPNGESLVASSPLWTNGQTNNQNGGYCNVNGLSGEGHQDNGFLNEQDFGYMVKDCLELEHQNFVKHAAQYEILDEFECVDENSVLCDSHLLVRHTLDDILLDAFAISESNSKFKCQSGVDVDHQVQNKEASGKNEDGFGQNGMALLNGKEHGIEDEITNVLSENNDRSEIQLSSEIKVNAENTKLSNGDIKSEILPLSPTLVTSSNVALPTPVPLSPLVPTSLAVTSPVPSSLVLAPNSHNLKCHPPCLDSSSLDQQSLNLLDFSSLTFDDPPILSPQSLTPQYFPDQNCESFTSEESLETEDETPTVRRCSSLKTGKTPPGTPSRKKIVRFADVLGLDLADVRTYLDEIPRVPISAYRDLANKCEQSSETPNVALDLGRTLLALFKQPISNTNYLNQVATNMVMLENAYLCDPIAFCIKGMVRVRNLDFNKSVHVRFSLDNWITSIDVEGQYVENSSDGFTDKFRFIFYAYTLTVGQKLEFAVRYQCKGQQFWDNNGGSNYRFQCLPTTQQKSPSVVNDDYQDQCAAFYYNGKEANEANKSEANVHDYILKKLERRNGGQQKSSLSVSYQLSKQEIFAIFIVLFSILFLYIRRLLVL